MLIAQTRAIRNHFLFFKRKKKLNSFLQTVLKYSQLFSILRLSQINLSEILKYTKSFSYQLKKNSMVFSPLSKNVSSGATREVLTNNIPNIVHLFFSRAFVSKEGVFFHSSPKKKTDI